VENLPPELRERESCGGVVVELTDPEGTNGQPVRHEELAALRGLAGDKEGWFWDVISSVDPAVLHPGQVFVHALHGILPNGER
jgi:hypothetical protein